MLNMRTLFRMNMTFCGERLHGEYCNAEHCDKEKRNELFHSIPPSYSFVR